MDPQVQNMMNSIHKLGLVNYVKHFDDENGFMWTSDSRTYDIGNDVLSDGHSGASFAGCLRDCQYFLNNPTDIPIEKNDDNDPESAHESVPETAPSCTASLNGSGSDYMFYESMDQNNKNAVDVMASQGMDKAVEFMTKGMTNGTMTYGEMRARFG